jgi:TPR repeat protein
MKAASLNNPSGMYNVGYYYENGIACLKDKKAAQFWYAKAVALGNERSVEGLKRIGKVK